MLYKAGEQKQGRCFGWVPCGNNPNCQRCPKKASLVDLKDKCLKDDNCVAVSCHYNQAEEGMCNKYMFSSSCEASNIQKRNGWKTYYIADSSKIHYQLFLNKERKIKRTTIISTFKFYKNFR